MTRMSAVCLLRMTSLLTRSLLAARADFTTLLVQGDIARHKGRCGWDIVCEHIVWPRGVEIHRQYLGSFVGRRRWPAERCD